MKIQSKIIVLFVGLGLITHNLQAVAVGDLIKRDPRKIKVTKGWVPGVAVLDLSNMNIDSLKGLEYVPGIEKVTRLYLNNNNINSIESGDLAAAVKLRALGLSNNSLKTVEPNAFAGLKNLKVLDLSSNNIAGIPNGGLNGMPGLRFLGMSSNPIANPKISLQAQVPKAFIATLPITKANLKKWAAVLGAGVAVLVAAVAGLMAVTKKEKPRPVIGELEGFGKVSDLPILETISLEEAWHREHPEEEPTINGVDLYGAAPYSPRVVSDLLGKGADINKRYTVNEQTPLMAAAKAGNIETVRLLIGKGADVNLVDAQGRTALDLTPSKYPEDRLIQEILKYQMKVEKASPLIEDILAQQPPEGETEEEVVQEEVEGESTGSENFHEGLVAERKEELERTRLGGEEKAKAMFAAQSGIPSPYVTTLDDAVASGSIPTLRKLLAEGASVDERFGDQNQTVLMMAAEKGDGQMIRYLVSAGANINLKDKKGETAADKVWNIRHKGEKGKDYYVELALFLGKQGSIRK